MPETIFNTACSPHNSINNAVPKIHVQNSSEVMKTNHERNQLPRLEGLASLGLTFGAPKTVKKNPENNTNA